MDFHEKTILSIFMIVKISKACLVGNNIQRMILIRDLYLSDIQSLSPYIWEPDIVDFPMTTMTSLLLCLQSTMNYSTPRSKAPRSW
jgi:hypothetical protein